MLSERDTTAIAHLHDEWIRRELSGELATLIDLCTDQITLMPPGQQRLTGRQAVADWLGQSGSELITATASIRDLRGDGGVAYKLADFQSTVREATSGEIHAIAGSHLWVLERDEEGTWRIGVLTWTLWR